MHICVHMLIFATSPFPPTFASLAVFGWPVGVGGGGPPPGGTGMQIVANYLRGASVAIFCNAILLRRPR
jgi:hypothetical protein